jgi:hypothetical protein
MMFALGASAALFACAHDRESRSTQSAANPPKPEQAAQAIQESEGSPAQGSHSPTTSASGSQGSSSQGMQGSSQGMQGSTSAQSSQSGSSAGRQTIDCPPEALAKAEQSLPSSSPVGTPGGTGSGSGADAVSGQGQVKRVEGSITQIDSSRTARGLEIGGVKVWVEPSTPVLLNCQQASFADLKQGTPVKAMYEEKNGRNIAKVVEAQK